MPANNRRQALVPRGATVLANPHGTAPGLWIEHDDAVIALVPGPPREMKPMMEGDIRTRLAVRAGDVRLAADHLHVRRGEREGLTLEVAPAGAAMQYFEDLARISSAWLATSTPGTWSGSSPAKRSTSTSHQPK